MNVLLLEVYYGGLWKKRVLWDAIFAWSLYFDV